MPNKLSRRSFLQLTTVTAAGVALAACAAPGATPAASQSGAAAGTTASAEKTNIRFHARVGVQGDYYTEMADAFNAAHPDINVTVETFPNDEYFQKIATMMAGGTVGDAQWTASILNYYTFAVAGAYMPVDDFIAKDQYDLSVFYPVAIQASKLEGKMYGLPWIVHPGRVGLYYNKTAFADASMDEPSVDWTYDDLVAAAKAMTRAKAVRPRNSVSCPTLAILAS